LTTSKVRRALVATHNLTDYAGSEVFTLELATELREMGWKVLVAALLFGEPMVSEFKKQQFEIVNLLKADPAIDNAQFDLAWIHHTPVFNELFIARKTQATTVVFCSLSHYEPLEQVPLCTENLDLLLAHSTENRSFIINELGLGEDQVIVFPNAVPSIYWGRPKEYHSHVLMRLAIISNHPPVEVLRAAEVLKKKGLKVIHIGQGGTQMLMRPNFLLNCDAVITIGKTIPYCFALKVPVYCYDHFGGPGWLSADNLDLAGEKNFSGRGFARKTPEVIAQEIVDGYQESLRDLNAFRNHAANHRDLRKNLALLLDQPRTPALGRTDFAMSTQTLRLHAQYMRLVKTLSVFRSFREAELDARDKEISRVKSTLSWRLTAPFRAAYNLVRRDWR
jgi:O-antigen biosynthesis protein